MRSDVMAHPCSSSNQGSNRESLDSCKCAGLRNGLPTDHIILAIVSRMSGRARRDQDHGARPAKISRRTHGAQSKHVRDGAYCASYSDRAGAGAGTGSCEYLAETATTSKQMTVKIADV